MGLELFPMAKVGVIADTHDKLSTLDRALGELKRRGVKRVLHAGDIIAPFTLRRILEGGFEFTGVYGNNDGELLVLARVAREAGATLAPPPLIVEVEGLKVVILHGAGGGPETRSLATALAKSGEYDVVIYGHTHEVDVRKVGRSLVVNPGEVCGYLTGKSTLAILDTERLEVELVEV